MSFSVGEGFLNKLWKSTVEYYVVLKSKILCQALKRHVGILNAYYQVERNQSERAQTVSFQLCDVPHKANLWRQ